MSSGSFKINTFIVAEVFTDCVGIREGLQLPALTITHGFREKETDLNDNEMQNRATFGNSRLPT